MQCATRVFTFCSILMYFGISKLVQEGVSFLYSLLFIPDTKNNITRAINTKRLCSPSNGFKGFSKVWLVRGSNLCGEWDRKWVNRS